MLIGEHLHLNLQSSIFLLIANDTADDIKPQRINSSTLTSIIISGTYKYWLYKQQAAKFKTYNCINVKLFPEEKKKQRSGSKKGRERKKKNKGKIFRVRMI